MNVWVLTTATLSPLARKLTASLASRGFEATVTVTNYGEMDGQALEPGSAYRDASPDITVLLADAHDLLRPLYEAPISRRPAERTADIEHAVSRVSAVISAAARVSAHVFVSNASAPADNAMGLLEASHGLALAAADYNRRLVAAAAGYTNVHVFDYAGLIAKVGYEAFHDRRLWAHARMRVSGDGVVALAELLARSIAATRRKPRKVVVVDLDNTLWGGVLGEVGSAGLQLGGEGVGVCFAEFQRALSQLRARGVLLAIASKNDHDDAMRTLAEHPGMVLKPDDFAATRINWQAKPESLRAIAAELNLGIDSLVFIDDSAHECAAVRELLPDVAVIELPEDPADYVASLGGCELLDTLAITDTDRQRSALVAQEQQRAHTRATAADMDSFLRSLDQQATLSRVGDATLARAAQLCARTNQFNLTLRRHDQSALRRLVDQGAVGLMLAAQDRLGDAGIVGFGLVSPSPERWQLDTLVISCRVIGRGLETVLLSELVRAARAAGAKHIDAAYVAGPRNAMCADFLADHGFEGEPPEYSFAGTADDIIDRTGPHHIRIVRGEP